MLSNRVLIVVNSVYQLITAIHMKRTILAQRNADLLLTDMLPNGEAYLPHLQEIRLFDRVIFARTREWIQKCSSGKKEDISELFQNIYQKFQRQFSGKNYYVPQTVYELANTLHYLGGHYAS